MANKKISELDLAASILDTDMFERATALATSERVPASLLKNYVVPSELSLTDGLAIETFESYAAGAISSFAGGIGWGTAAGVGSGCTIVSRTNLNGSTYKALSITAGQFGRNMGWLANWNRVKIFIAWRINHAASFTQDGYVGICSGTANMAASATTSNFIGLRYEQTTPNGAVFTAGTLAPSFNYSTTPRFVTRRGTTTTDRTGGAGGTARYVTATQGYQSVFLYEIGRPVFASPATSVTYAGGFTMDTLVAAEFSKAKSSIIDMAHQQSGSGAAAHDGFSSVTAATPTTLSHAFDESTGVFDTLNLTWPHAHALEISCIAIQKVN